MPPLVLPILLPRRGSLVIREKCEAAPRFVRNNTMFNFSGLDACLTPQLRVHIVR